MNNDLISREALKKQVKELLELAVKRVVDTPNNSPCYRMYVAQENERARLIDLIDNAPTVEPKKEIVPVCKVTFDKEQLQEIVDKKVAEMIERPQGEWKLVSDINNDINVVCPFCNKTRIFAYAHGYSIEEVKSQLQEVNDLPNYSEDCGADIRKGGTE